MRTTGAPSIWTDAQLLAVLDAVADGRTLADIGASLGKSRNSIASIVKRIRDETDASESPLDLTGAPARRPENRNGGMPRHWWRAGLVARRGRAA